MLFTRFVSGTRYELDRHLTPEKWFQGKLFQGVQGAASVTWQSQGAGPLVGIRGQRHPEAVEFTVIYRHSQDSYDTFYIDFFCLFNQCF